MRAGGTSATYLVSGDITGGKEIRQWIDGQKSNIAGGMVGWWARLPIVRDEDIGSAIVIQGGACVDTPITLIGDLVGHGRVVVATYLGVLDRRPLIS